MLTVREAALNDFEKIAELHAWSWLNTYRGILPDSYLDNNLIGERTSYWQRKMSLLTEKEFVLMAEDGNNPVGFIAVLDRPENGYDAFVDNLHVSPDRKGRGIGKLLMQEAAKKLSSTNRRSAYLWVLKGNNSAEHFYQALGGKPEDISTATFGNKSVEQIRYSWSSFDGLLSK
jgi:ribosomal protein S18 acetylase RimI-like enzyme